MICLMGVSKIPGDMHTLCPAPFPYDPCSVGGSDGLSTCARLSFIMGGLNHGGRFPCWFRFSTEPISTLLLTPHALSHELDLPFSVLLSHLFVAPSKRLCPRFKGGASHDLVP